jgi:hypothetical protein
LNSLDIPIKAREFDIKNVEHFKVVYYHPSICSARKLVNWLKSDGGVNISETTVHNYRTSYHLPVANKSYDEKRFITPAILNPNSINPETNGTSEKDLPSLMREYLKRSSAKSVEELSDWFNVCPRQIREAVKVLEEDSVLVNLKEDCISLENDMVPQEHPFRIDFRKYKEIEIPYGVTADNHIGSKYERMDVLEALFDRYEDYGVKTVFQGGNILEGECSFNKFEVYVHGVDDQVDNLIQKWPQRKGITTKFVTGDDHEGWYVQREHINIGDLIEAKAAKAGRKDLIHLGYMERDISLDQEKGSAIIRVIHAGGGSAYAVSYTSQKYAESLQGGEKPQIVLVGHFHKYEYGYPREIHMIQTGCTQDQTRFMRKKKLQAHVGGVVLWVTQNEIGVITKVRVEWIPFYDKKFYTYNW